MSEVKSAETGPLEKHEFAGVGSREQAARGRQCGEDGIKIVEQRFEPKPALDDSDKPEQNNVKTLNTV